MYTEALDRICIFVLQALPTYTDQPVRVLALWYRYRYINIQNIHKPYRKRLHACIQIHDAHTYCVYIYIIMYQLEVFEWLLRVHAQNAGTQHHKYPSPSIVVDVVAAQFKLWNTHHR